MILTEIVLAAIGGLVAVGAALYKTHQRSIPCNSCAFLVKKGGGYWKYTCHRGSAWSFDDTFDHPPKYCKYYKPKEGGRDVNDYITETIKLCSEINGPCWDCEVRDECLMWNKDK